MPGQSKQTLQTYKNLINDTGATLQKRTSAVVKSYQEEADRRRRAIKKKELEPYSQDPEKLARLSTLPFWCGNETIHLERPDDYHEEWCCFNHVVGLPTHRITGMPTPLQPYQMEFFEEIENKKRATQGKSANKFHVNKGRQMGFTEITVRIIAYYCFHDYAGWNVGIIAATKGELARKDLRRMQRLFKHIWGAAVYDMDSEHLVLANGTVIEAFSAAEEAITGDTKYKCIFMDEAAKWKMVDDSGIFNSIMPIVDSGAADLFLVSTPKGPIKMFYSIHLDHKNFVMLEYDIWRTEGNLYTRKQIEDLLANSIADPNQEYLCKFTFGKNAILGVVSGDIRDARNLEWDAEPVQQLTKEQLEAFVNSGPDEEEEEWVDPREEEGTKQHNKPVEQI